MKQMPERYPNLTCPQQQWLAEPTPNELPEARATPSPVVPVSTVAGWAHDDQKNRDQSSTLNCRVRQKRGWLNQRRPMEQRPERHPHQTCPTPQWLAEPTPTKRSEARAEHSLVVPATTVGASDQADLANRGQSCNLTCRARHHIG
jgi:hypothetical protein